MIVVIFKIRALPGKAELFVETLGRIASASRELEGVISFDIGRDLLDPDSFVATEVFQDSTVLGRQQELPQVAEARDVLANAVAAPPETVMYEISR